MNPTVPGGPDTEDVERALAAADGCRAGHWPAVAAVLAFEVRHLRAVLARPAAGRDLTAQDVWDAMEQGVPHGERLGPQVVADFLNEIARPAVAGTDAPCQGTCTGCGAGEDQVCADSCRCVASGVHDRDGYTPDMPEYTAPATDTAAPGTYIAALIRADEQDQHDAVDPEVGGPTSEYLRGYRAAVARSAEVAAEALPQPLIADRVLTAQDVDAAVSSAPDAADSPGIAMQQHVADYLNRVLHLTANDGAPPAVDWSTVPGCSMLSFEENEACGSCEGCLAAEAAENPDPAPWPRDTHPVRQEYEDVVQRVAQELFALHGGPGSVWADLTCELAEGWREQARTVLRGARVPVLVSVEESDDVDW